MSKKLAILFVTIIIATMMITACAPSVTPTAEVEAVEATEAPETEADSSEVEEAESSEAEEAAAPGVDYSKYAGTELIFLRHSGYDAEWMVTKADEFYEETGIKVTIEQIAYSEVHNKIVVDTSSEGGIYDMFATTDYWLPEFYEGGWVIDQYQFLNNPDLYDPALAIEEVSQAMLDANTIDGNLLAFPWKFNSQLLLYRNDLISNPPTNWDELLELAQENNNDTTTGIALALGKASVMDIYLNLLYQNGGTLLSDDLSTCNLDSPEAKEALEFLLQLAENSTDGAINSHWDEAAAIFSQGNAAMVPLVNSTVGNVLDPEKSLVSENVGFSELPGKTTSAAASNTWGISITRNSKNPEAAFLFIQYLMQPDSIREIVEATNGSTIPIRGSLLADADFQTEYPWFTVMNAIATTPGHAYSYPKSTQTTSIMEILAGHIQNAVNGAETVDDALMKAKSEIENLL